MILVGLPGAGKTTFYRKYFAATHVHVSKDLWPHARNRAARERRVITDALARGQSVVVDNTNPTAVVRAALIELARKYEASVIGYFCEVSTREAVARNARRTGRARVPDVAIFTSAKRLEKPDRREGFDQLFRVRPAPGGSAVTELA